MLSSTVVVIPFDPISQEIEQFAEMSTYARYMIPHNLGRIRKLQLNAAGYSWWQRGCPEVEIHPSENRYTSVSG